MGVRLIWWNKTQLLPSSGCVNFTIWMHHMDVNCIEKKLDRNCTRMLQAILNKTWKQHPTKQQLCVHLPSISKTIQIRWARYVEHCWRSKDELLNDVLLWNPLHGWASVGCPTRTYLQLCTDTGCRLEDLPAGMDDRWIAKEFRKSVLAAWNIFNVPLHVFILFYFLKIYSIYVESFFECGYINYYLMQIIYSTVKWLKVFLSNINFVLIIYLLFQVFLSSKNNFQTYLFDPHVGPSKYYPSATELTCK